MDFRRKDGESERGYYARVAREIKFGVLGRPRVEALEAYQAGRLSVGGLEERLVALFSRPEKKPKAAPEPAPAAPDAPEASAPVDPAAGA